MQTWTRTRAHRRHGRRRRPSVVFPAAAAAAAVALVALTGYEHDNGVGSDSFKKALAQAARGGSANGAGGSGAEEEKQQELRRQVGREIARLPADEVKNYVLEMFGCTDTTAMSHAQAPSPVDADRSSPAAIGSKVQIVSPLDVAVGGVGRRSTDPLDLFEDDPDGIEGRSTAPPRLSSAPAALAADDRHISLDELTFQRRIGSGGFSTTYLARWSKNQQRTVAVKVASSVGDSLEQWRVEVRSLTRLVHPNIIRYLGYVASAPTYCLVLSTVRAAISTRRCEAARAARHPASRCASARASPPRSRTSTASA